MQLSPGPAADRTWRSALARSTTSAALTAAAVAVVVGLPASAAQATSYRYWSYWTGGSGSWTFSSQGAARLPGDGTVDGWRFAVSDAVGSTTTPRSSSDFGAICGSTDPVAGMKRVGLVVDYGTTDDAPPGETPPDGPVSLCLVVPPEDTGYQVLDAAADLRVESGLVCAVSAPGHWTPYPATGCGEPVSTDPTRSTSGGSASTSRDGGSPSGPATGDSSNPTASGRTGAGAGAPSATPRDGDATPRAGPSGSSDPTSTLLAVPATDSGGGAGGSGGPPAGLLAGLVVVVALGAGAALVTRRRG